LSAASLWVWFIEGCGIWLCRMPHSSVLRADSPLRHGSSPSPQKCGTPMYFPGANLRRRPAIPQQTKHLQIYLDKYGTLMVTLLLIVGRHSRRSIPHPSNPLPYYPLSSSSSNPFPHNLLSDPHPLNPAVSTFYKNMRGRVAALHGPPTIALSPLAATLMNLPASVANKRLIGLAKYFRCNTYKKHGGPFRRSHVPTFTRPHVWHRRTSQAIMSAAIPPLRIKNDARMA